jgi:superfamily II DNA or RNA helicase
MSFSLDLEDLSKKQLSSIKKEFVLQAKKTQYNDKPEIHKCYFQDNEEIYLPFGAWQKYSDEPPNGESDTFPRMNKNSKFTKKLLDAKTDEKHRDQNVVAKLALEKLEKTGTVFMALFTGFGKSATAIYLSIKLKLKVVVLCHLKLVREQWPSEYKKFSSDVKVQHVKGKTLDPSADVYVIGIRKASKMSRDDFLSIGTVIIDEAHIATLTAFTKTLLLFQPRYVIGLSATPDRQADGLDSVFKFYFGSDFITRKENKPFTVYKVNTKYKPTITYTIVKGKSVPNWCEIIKSVEINEDRWNLIANIVLNNLERKGKIMVLCNRNVLAIGINNILMNKKVKTALLIGNKVVPETKHKVIVAGFKKAGVGFNDPDITMLIIASDIKDVRQYEGRCRTVNNTIYHIVDNYKTFDNHYKKCEKWYIQKGGTIKILGKDNGAVEKPIVPRKMLPVR